MKRTRRRKKILLVVGLLVVGPCTAVRCAGVEGFTAEGPGMGPAVCAGDRFLVERVTLGLHVPFSAVRVMSWGQPTPGDVVVIEAPDGMTVLKRVIGVGGDRIELVDDRILRNGHPIQVSPLSGEEPDDQCQLETLGDRRWRTLASVASVPSNYAEVTVPPDHVYVLGDHRDRSNDSRFFGSLPVRGIHGRFVFRYWRDVHPHDRCDPCAPEP